MKKIYTAALVGCGRIGFSLGFDKKREQPASHTMALKKNKRIKLVAGCDTDPVKLESWKRFVRCGKIYTDVSDMLRSCKTDIIAVAVNEEFHLSVALDVIRSRPRLVILEKPVALNTGDAKKIYSAAKEFNVPVLVNHERRFALDYSAAANYLSEIGDIQSIRGVLCSGLRVYSPEDEKTGAYSLLHDGTHLIDIILYFFEKLSGKEKKRLLYRPSLSGVYYDMEKPVVVRNLCANYKTDVCPDVSVTISGRSKFFAFEVEITGTQGRICIGNGYMHFYKSRQSKLYTGFYSLEENRFVRRPKRTLYFSNMVQNAVDFLDGKAPLGSSLEDGINVMAVIDEIKEGLKKENGTLGN
ncbi:Gfo/Idh/MocA family protein [Treponema parvum]|uniref:Gfo/Idh/MocA family protein n=1 Tax=Treponema parvum TaxID=138851 RepID=UPI001AEBC5EB|nr:Gfo/Idh/MocA family oxidoreductase [Treponema parvum]QTQ16958.1 Gfo/Idh/MocA family oxidoreductase [Treponema parvum]